MGLNIHTDVTPQDQILIEDKTWQGLDIHVVNKYFQNNTSSKLAFVNTSILPTPYKS